MGFFAWLRARRASGPGVEERGVLEDWVCRRFQMASSDPMDAVIGAVGRLTDAGMSGADATDTVLRILSERQADLQASAPGIPRNSEWARPG
jgi:hypothetical protein